MNMLDFNNASGEDLEYGMKTIFEGELDIDLRDEDPFSDGFQIVESDNL